MKNFAEKLIKRNYKKRIIAAIIAAAVLVALTAALIPLTLGKQISELRALEEERENNEHGTAAEIAEEGAKENERQGIKEEKQRHNDKEHEIKAMLRKVTPVSVGVKITFAVIAVIALLIGAFYWITVVEWLYKTAVNNNLNRALWPMLGLLFNILVIPALLVVLYDPKRISKKVQ